MPFKLVVGWFELCKLGELFLFVFLLKVKTFNCDKSQCWVTLTFGWGWGDSRVTQWRFPGQSRSLLSPFLCTTKARWSSCLMKNGLKPTDVHGEKVKNHQLVSKTKKRAHSDIWWLNRQIAPVPWTHENPQFEFEGTYLSKIKQEINWNHWHKTLTLKVLMLIYKINDLMLKPHFLNAHSKS